VHRLPQAPVGSRTDRGSVVSGAAGISAPFQLFQQQPRGQRHGAEAQPGGHAVFLGRHQPLLELSETDDEGRPAMFGKVAVAAVVGNEDGAHKIIADLFQALNDVGFTVPAQGATYWNGEAMQGGDYQDLDETPKAVASTNATLVRNAVHLANLLRTQQYPAS